MEYISNLELASDEYQITTTFKIPVQFCNNTILILNTTVQQPFTHKPCIGKCKIHSYVVITKTGIHVP